MEPAVDAGFCFSIAGLNLLPAGYGEHPGESFNRKGREGRYRVIFRKSRSLHALRMTSFMLLLAADGGFGGGFAEDFWWDLFNGYLKFEHRGFRAAAPAGYFPVSADEFCVGVLGEVDEQWNLSWVELLRERSDWLGGPRRSIGGAVDGDV